MLPELANMVAAFYEENARTVLIVVLSGGIALLLCVGVVALLSLRYGARARWRRRVSVILENRLPVTDDTERLHQAQRKQMQAKLRQRKRPLNFIKTM